MPVAAYGTCGRPATQATLADAAHASRGAKLDRSHLKIDIKIGGTYRALAPSLENEVFRIAQEAFANIVRHAKATHATLDLRYHPNDLTLTISDNGVGFQTTDTTCLQRATSDFKGCDERAEQIGGTLNVESSPESGTTVTLICTATERKGMKAWQIESEPWL